MTLLASLPPFRLSAICLSTWISLGVISPVYAAVVVDQQKSPSTTVSIADNGATVVDVSAPSAGGVSHNYYTQFDVNRAGVVLNNAAGSSSTTLAGKIDGNSNMTGGGCQRDFKRGRVGKPEPAKRYGGSRRAKSRSDYCQPVGHYL